ncbi:MAG: phage tail sheath family protein [Gammaproteobacteria bacterium]
MSSYHTPGVYIQEVSTGAKPITQVGTGTAGLIGRAPSKNALTNQAVVCQNKSEFYRKFSNRGDEDTHLSLAVANFFDNGGSRCYVVNVGDGPIAGKPGERTGLGCFEPYDEIAILAAPGYSDLGTHQALIGYCERMKNCIAILDAPQKAAVAEIAALTKVAKIKAGGAAAEGAEDTKASSALRPPNSSYAAFYFPWVWVKSPLAPEKIVSAPPSGFMAGIYARTDAKRGVHKAPANEAVTNALGLDYEISNSEQETLNDAGVNCIRYFSSSGIRVWGARTLDSGEWKYINVRRLFIMIEESIARSTQWVVFEPNDEFLWKAVVRDVTAFLKLLWRDGALQGSTPEQAFFVKCDAETNPPEVIDAGRLEIEIGIAPVKPAEFIVFRIGQWSGGTTVETEEAAE